MPSLSVIIPVYNRPDELRRALSSLSRQTVKDFDVIICDDGSNVELSPIISEFAGQLEILYKKIENSGGPARPRNIAVSLSEKKWVSFLDSDDWWIPTRIEEISPILSSTTADVVYHKLVVSGRGRRNSFFSGKVIGNDISGHPFVHLMEQGNCIPNSSAIVRRELFLSVEGFDESGAVVEDFDLWLKLAIGGAKFFFIDHALGFYWVGSHAITDNSALQAKMHERLYFRYKELLDEKNKLKAEMAWKYAINVYKIRSGDMSIAKEFLIDPGNMRYIRFYLKILLKTLFQIFR